MFKKKPIDKVRAVDLTALEMSKTNDGMLLATIAYDVRKLRRMEDDDLTELLFEKTLKLYPFAIVDKRVSRLVASGVALMHLWLPLHPGMHTSPIQQS